MPQTKSIETRAVQDFLKAAYTLRDEDRPVSTNALAEALDVSAPSVTDMAVRLSTTGLIFYRKHHGVVLTQEDRQVAYEILHRHKCIERFLIHALDYTLDQAHEEAEQMEHAVSERFVTALEQRMNESFAEDKGSLRGRGSKT